MILGHIGLALGARAADREAPLPWLVVASIAPDVLDVGLAAAAVCNANGEFTHSLAAIAVTAVALGAAGWWATRSRKTALLIAALVVSHLLADYLTGAKALWIGGPVVGLDLYRWPAADFGIEAAVITAGWWAARRWGDLPRWIGARTALVVLLAGQFAANLVQANTSTTAMPSICSKASLVGRAPRHQ